MNSEEIIADFKFLNTNASLLFDLSKRNQLYHTDITKLWFINDEYNEPLIQKIVKQSQILKREYALNTTLLVTHFIQWRVNEQDNFIITPFIYQSCDIHKTKRETETVKIQILDETLILNPILTYLFDKHFKIQLPTTITSADDIINLIKREFSTCKLTEEFEDNGWLIIKKNAVGIFNYKKLIAYHDYQKIIDSKTGLHLTLNGKSYTTNSNDTKIWPIQIIDNAQQKAVQTSLQNNTVVQGPPGTGKSTFVAALIKQLLLNDKTVLFVSEKRTAMEVVFEKLTKRKLESAVVFLSGTKNEKRDFYKSIAKLLDQIKKISPTSNTTLAEANTDLIDYYQHHYLNQKNQIVQLEEELLDFENQETNQVKGNIPNYDTWLKHETELKTIEGISPQKNISKNLLLKLNSSVFNDINTSLLKNIHLAINLSQELEHVSKQLDKNFNYEHLIHLCITASVLKLANRDALFLMDETHKKYKSFNTIAKKYQQLEVKLGRQQKLNSQWKNKPKPAEINLLISELKQPKTKKSLSILNRMKRNKIHSENYFEGLPNDISTITKIQLLEELQQEWKLQDEIDQLKIKLKFDYHIFNPSHEIDQILKIRLKLKSIGANYYTDILSFQNHLELIETLDKSHPIIQRFNGIIAYLGLSYKEKTLLELREDLEEIAAKFDHAKEYIHHYLIWNKIPFVIKNFITSNNHHVKHLGIAVRRNALLFQTKFTPNYKDNSGKNLVKQINVEKKIIKQNAAQLRDITLKKIADKINDLEQLVLKNRLKNDEKLIKAEYKKEKRILLHETKKVKQHLSIKEITTSCPNLVFNLKPIWIMNPLEVASCFTCEAELFDYVIFDEASQISTEDAIPVLYRAKRAIVVGDSNQMPPGNFFQSNSDTLSLLDVAAMHYKEVHLTHHYRSKHPNLIQFSNQRFYDGQLKTLPPPTDYESLNLVKLNGVFENNVNELEAEKVCELYENLLQKNITDVGIITFSLEQQKLIEKKIQQLGLPKNEQLLVRNIENMQGQEREHIIISMAYAKNSAGKMNLNFGPINQINGLKRFNVMITRASQTLHFITSTSVTELASSNNEGIETISDYIQFLEENQTTVLTHFTLTKSEQLVHQFLIDQKTEFKFFSAFESSYIASAFVLTQLNKIILVNPGLANEVDLMSLFESLSENFSDILIITTSDLLYQKDSTFAEIKSFLKNK